MSNYVHIGSARINIDLCDGLHFFLLLDFGLKYINDMLTDSLTGSSFIYRERNVQAF